MKKYTFITEYRGGTFIYQYMAPDLDNALYIWAKNLNKKYFTAHKRKCILDEIHSSHSSLLPVENMCGVWSMTFLSGKFLIVLFIFETA